MIYKVQLKYLYISTAVMEDETAVLQAVKTVLPTTDKSLVFNQSCVYRNKVTVYDIPSHMNQFKAAKLQQRL